MQRLMYCLAALFLPLLVTPALRGEDLNVPAETIGRGTPTLMMHRYLTGQVKQAIDRWKDDYEKRKTPEQIAEYQKRYHDAFISAVGGLPERTPLNSRIVGTVARKGYRVEKIVFESQPKHYVTGLLFLPEAKRSKSRSPGVLVPCGHAFEAKGYAAYQTMGALLALNGMAAFVFDPIDQGERGQYMGKDGWPDFWGIDAHTRIGLCSIPLGRNTALFEIWDGMRAIDYLQSRPEVDRKRIGCTGNSGGATQTCYLMSLDDRIRAAAPSCYITSTEREMELRGADDAEQQIFNQLNAGPHEADFIMMRAPSPVLEMCATHDFFDVGGTWDSLRYAKRLFTRMGFPERVDILENDAGHNYDTVQREGAARWMSRWLQHKDRVIVEPKHRTVEREAVHLHARQQGDVAARRSFGLRSQRRLREPVGQAAWVLLGVGRPQDFVRRGAAGGRRPQAGRLAETTGGDARHDRPQRLQDREARDPTGEGGRAAGAALPARKSERRPRGALPAR